MIKKHNFTSRKPIFRENKKICKVLIFFNFFEEYFSFSSQNLFSTCKTRFFYNKIYESAQFRAEIEKKEKNNHFGPVITAECENSKEKKKNISLNHNRFDS